MADLARARRILAFAALAGVALAVPASAGSDPLTVHTGTWATPAGIAGVDVELDGEPLRVAYEDQGTTAIGDDEVVVAEGLRGLQVTWNGAPLDLALAAGLRGVVVHHGLAAHLAASLDELGALLPADARIVAVYVGPDGADARLASGAPWPVRNQIWLIGGTAPAMVWPAAWDSFGWGLGADDLTLPESLLRTSDYLVDELGVRKAHIACAKVFDATGAEVPLCADLGTMAAALLPNVVLHGELQGASFTLERGIAAAPLRALREPSAPAPTPQGVPDAAWADALPATFAGADLAAMPRALAIAPTAPAASPGQPHPSLVTGGVATPVAWWLPIALAAVGLGALPLWALYRRILPHRALAHPVRDRILETVRAHPGIHESDLARLMGLRHNHVQYHLRVLEEVGIVETRAFGGLKCIFELGKLSPAEKAVAMAQRGRTPELLALIGGAPGIAQREIARRLGMSESSIKWHLDRLEGSGVVRTERAHGAKRVWPAVIASPPPGPAAAVALSAPL